MFNKFLSWIQFSNIYIAFCAVFSCIANLSFYSQFKLPILILIVIFLGVIWFYNLSYQKIVTQQISKNLRLQWFLARQKKLFTIQATLFSCIAIFSFLLLPNLANFFTYTNLAQQLFLLSFIGIAIFYNFGLINKNSKLSIRKYAILKPLFISYVWMGVSFVFPYTFVVISNNKLLLLDFKFWLIFIEGFYTITLLAILYDVKDFEVDNAVSLKTWVVKLGTQKLFNLLILPIISGGILVLIALTILNIINVQRSAALIIVYSLILFIAYKIQHKKSILWHLTIIDGVILLKSIAIILLNYNFS